MGSIGNAISSLFSLQGEQQVLIELAINSGDFW
jgi:hypothetical protein